MKCIVGLGNPGQEYAATRHNAGFRVLDALASCLVSSREEMRWQAWVVQGSWNDQTVCLLKPMTYMNRSGDALGAMLDALDEELPLEDLLVVTDDIHLPVGRMRFRPRGSAGGHNGLASIETALATQEYARLRIGVGREGEAGLIDHVLGPFGEQEETVLAEVMDVAREAIGLWVREGISPCQNQYNGWRAPSMPAETTDETVSQSEIKVGAPRSLREEEAGQQDVEE